MGVLTSPSPTMLNVSGKLGFYATLGLGLGEFSKLLGQMDSDGKLIVMGI